MCSHEHELFGNVRENDGGADYRKLRILPRDACAADRNPGVDLGGRRAERGGTIAGVVPFEEVTNRPSPGRVGHAKAGHAGEDKPREPDSDLVRPWTDGDFPQ